MGGLIGQQTNMNNSRFEMDLVYSAAPCLSSDDNVQLLLMFFSFRRRLIQFIDLGNGVWPKKYNILLHLLPSSTRSAGKTFLFSLTTINHPQCQNKSFEIHIQPYSRYFGVVCCQHAMEGSFTMTQNPGWGERGSENLF